MNFLSNTSLDCWHFLVLLAYALCVDARGRLGRLFFREENLVISTIPWSPFLR